jgi:ASC-1-like (ASCH) protein
VATFDAGVHVEAFENMEKGSKTVYAVPATLEYSMICSGDRLEFGSLGSITIGMVRRYGNLEELCEAEGWANLVPEVSSQEAAIEAVRAIVEWDDKVEADSGVLSLRVREVRRKL